MLLKYADRFQFIECDLLLLINDAHINRLIDKLMDGLIDLGKIEMAYRKDPRILKQLKEEEEKKKRIREEKKRKKEERRKEEERKRNLLIEEENKRKKEKEMKEQKEKHQKENVLKKLEKEFRILAEKKLEQETIELLCISLNLQQFQKLVSALQENLQNGIILANQAAEKMRKKREEAQLEMQKRRISFFLSFF